MHIDATRLVRAWPLRLSLLVFACAAWLTHASADDRSADPWPPQHLKDTGLYSDWTARTVAPENLPYSPQYPLWSDGATKARWLFIPTGRFIDATNPDVWQFPIGTRAWKEFRFGRRVETRFIEHTADGWRYAAYSWNDDETEAVLAPETGIRYSVDIRDGVRHAIPSRADCRACHEAGPVRLLGVSALQLSTDRDPRAPHAEPVPAHGIDLRALVRQGLLRNVPGPLLDTPPRIRAESETARAALGYLHANCGTCHTGAGELASLGFALNYDVAAADGRGAHALLTTVGRPGRFRISAAPDLSELIRPGDPERSMLIARMASRHPVLQMPPLATRLVDDDAVALLRRWIAEQAQPVPQFTPTKEGK